MPLVSAWLVSVSAVEQQCKPAHSEPADVGQRCAIQNRIVIIQSTADERTGDGFCSVVVDRWTDVAEGSHVKETCLAEICNVTIHGKTFIVDDTKKLRMLYSLTLT